jgi:uncharacterized SAM-binding protein YcdF (DUF218 family)
MIEALIMPPGGVILLIFTGLLLRKRWQKSGNVLIVLALVILYVTSAPAIVRPLEEYASSRYEVVDPNLIQSGAIVVLGSGRRDFADEFEQIDSVTRFGLERLRYAAWLHRRTGLPVLASGGRVFDEPDSEASLMDRYFREQGLQLTWGEEQSRTTYENAVHSKRVLNQFGINRVILVTHGLHMPRAVWSFKRVGMEVVPAPTVIHANSARGGVLDFLPNAAALHTFDRIAHEWLGQLWYRLRY